MGQNLDIDSLNDEETWNAYVSIADLEDPDFDKVMNGIDIRFNIKNYFTEFGIRVKEKSGKILFYRNGSTISYKKGDIDIEIIKRVKLMKEKLHETYGRNPVVTARGI